MKEVFYDRINDVNLELEVTAKQKYEKLFGVPAYSLEAKTDTGRVVIKFITEEEFNSVQI